MLADILRGVLLGAIDATIVASIVSAPTSRYSSDSGWSLDIFRAMGARPFVARVTAELGEVRNEDGLIDEGMSMLEALGDLDQAERVARRRQRDRV